LEKKVEDMLEAWVNDRREIVLACDSAGRITWADPGARFALKAEPGRDLESMLAPGDHIRESLRALLERALTERVTTPHLPLRVNGETVPFVVSAQPDNHGGIIIVGTSTAAEDGKARADMDRALGEVRSLNQEIARHKRELETAYSQLDDSNRGVVTLHAEIAEQSATLQRNADVRTRMLSNVSHELRTPLHTILGLSRLLLDASDGPLTDEQQKQIRFIRTAAEEMSQMVNDLLDLSKAEAGKVVLRPEGFRASDLVAAFRGMLRPLVPPDSPLNLVFEEAPPDLRLETDRQMIGQVVRNLVSNALKFTERGEVRVRVAPDEDDERYVLFQVSDTGIGIADEHKDLIFEEFGQVPGPLQTKVKGTGLGLPLARKHAELLAGTLTFVSEEGNGSTFTLRIPAVHPEAVEFESIAKRPLEPGRAPVLVVEDDRKTVFIYEKYLAMAGFQVVPARTIADARRTLATLRPAAIVLDIMLDGETSWKFLGDVKSDPLTADIPVLVVTVTNKEQRARALGADEFWLKPVDQGRLLRKLRSFAAAAEPVRVLVIDDDERARYLIRKTLEGTPFEMLEASSAQEGLFKARQGRPQIILLDFLLQEGTAFDVLDDLKSDPLTRDIPVIVVTSHILDAEERDRLAAETTAIVSKESLSRELAINRIRDALRKAGVGARSPRPSP